MPKLDRYPYKYMLSIVNTLSSDGVTLGEIMIASGACNPDSVELMSMLKYLTSLGQVKHEDGLYLKLKSSLEPARKPRRKKFIKELDDLLNGLSVNPQSVQELVNHMNWSGSPSELQLYLDFLVQITAKGRIEGEVSLLGRLFQRGQWVIS